MQFEPVKDCSFSTPTFETAVCTSTFETAVSTITLEIYCYLLAKSQTYYETTVFSTLKLVQAFGLKALEYATIFLV